MEPQIYYKVVREIPGCNYVSPIASGDFSLIYEIGKVTTPNLGKIFVFKTIKDVDNFINWRGPWGYHVLKVEVVGNVYECKSRLEHIDLSYSNQYVKLYWESGNKDGKWSPPIDDWWKGQGMDIEKAHYLGWSCGHLPSGTYLADAVLPIELINP